MWQIAKNACHLARACALHWNGLNLWRAKDTSSSLNKMKSTEPNATQVDQRNIGLVGGKKPPTPSSKKKKVHKEKKCDARFVSEHKKR